MNRHRPLRSLAILALLPLFGMVFWLTAAVASSIPGLLVVGVIREAHPLEEARIPIAERDLTAMPARQLSRAIRADTLYSWQKAPGRSVLAEGIASIFTVSFCQSAWMALPECLPWRTAKCWMEAAPAA